MRVMQVGATGDDIKRWQAFLRGIAGYAVKADGSFGPLTVAATQDFQRHHGLEADGIVGDRTLGTAMQQGLKLAQPDLPLPGGPKDGVSFINDAWLPPAPPSEDVHIVSRDPRVITAHQPGVLPCPKNPPPPRGWTYLTGSAPREAIDFAVTIESSAAKFPMGSFVQALVGGQLLAARVEWHTYQGKTGKQGCFRGTSLFHPVTIV